MKNFLNINDLKDYFNVSALTIRKDLDCLKENKLVEKVYGGVKISESFYNRELAYDNKLNLNLLNKRLIGKEASKYINGNETISLDTGTTNLQLAIELKNLNFENKKLTVLTYDLKIALELCLNPNIKILFLGGFINNSQNSVTSFFPTRPEDLNQIIIDKFFLGVDGIDLNEGYTSITIEDGICKKILSRISKKIIVLADSSKFGQVKYYKIDKINTADIIISDNKIHEDYIKYCNDKHIILKIAEDI